MKHSAAEHDCRLNSNELDISQTQAQLHMLLCEMTAYCKGMGQQGYESSPKRGCIASSDGSQTEVEGFVGCPVHLVLVSSKLQKKHNHHHKHWLRPRLL